MSSLKIYLLAERLLRSQTTTLTELHEELLYKALKEKFEKKKLREEYSDSKTDTQKMIEKEKSIKQNKNIEEKGPKDNSKTNSELEDRTSSSSTEVTPDLKEG